MTKLTASNTPASHPATDGSRVPRLLAKLALLAVLIGLAILSYVKFGDSLTLESLAAHEATLRAYQRQYPLLVYSVAFLAYVAVTGLSLPGATGMTLVYGWYFGLVRAVVLVSFASTTGATLAFLLSRYLLRSTIQERFGKRLATINANLEREGAFYLFTLRLIPAIPFFVINVVMGLTPMKTRTYWWVSQLGMFPGTIVYVYAGSSVPDLTTLAERGVGGILSPQLLTAFVLLGLFPLVVKQIMKRIPRSEQTTIEASVTIEAKAGLSASPESMDAPRNSR